MSEETKFNISIKNTETNEVVNYEDSFDENVVIFMWTEGNYSCDCNRYLFFERAKGNNPNWDDGECSTTVNKYLVNIKDKNEYWVKEF